MNKRDDIAAAILVGGKSSRMGKDKALLEFNGISFIRRVAEVFFQECSPVIVISDHGERYSFLGLPVCEDEYKNCGPLGGIHTALKNVPTNTVCIASCDIPFIHRDLLRQLLDVRGEEDITVFSSNGMVQPLFGIYHTRILPTLEKHLNSNRFSVLDFLRDVKTVHVTPPFNTMAAHALLNINTPTEYIQHCGNIGYGTIDVIYDEFHKEK